MQGIKEQYIKEDQDLKHLKSDIQYDDKTKNIEKKIDETEMSLGI